MVFIVVFLSIIVASLIGVGIYHLPPLRKRRSLRDQSRTLDWVESVEQAETDKDIVDLGRLHTQRYYSEYDRYSGRKPLDDAERQQAAEEAYRAAVRREDSRAVASRLGDTPDPLAIASACLKVFGDKLDPQLALECGEGSLGMLFQTSVFALRALAYDGNEASIVGYIDILSDERTAKLCKHYELPLPTFPYTWNDLVAAQVMNPNTWYFQGFDELSTATVGSLAAKALAENNLTYAKIALAYCQVESYYPRYSVYENRDAIGDVLLADLLNLVEQLNGDKIVIPGLTEKALR